VKSRTGNKQYGRGVLYWVAGKWRPGVPAPQAWRDDEVPEGATVRATFRSRYGQDEKGAYQTGVDIVLDVQEAPGKWSQVTSLRLQENRAAGDTIPWEWARNLDKSRGHTGVCLKLLARLPELKSGKLFRSAAFELALWVNKPLAVADFNPVLGPALLPRPETGLKK
jgi:hypothetical protein